MNKESLVNCALFEQKNRKNSVLKTIARDRCNNAARDKQPTDTSECNTVSVVLNDTVDLTEDPTIGSKIDGRKGNKGSSVRERFSMIAKYQHIIACQSWIEDQKANNKSHSISDYCRQTYASNRFYYWSNNLSKWQKKGTLEKIIEAASNKLYHRMLTLSCGNRKKSPLADMEIALMKRLKEHRSKGRKVSRRWICINASKIQHDLDEKNGTGMSKWFKASSGWFHRFLKRNHIKFRKRKSGKKNCTDENLPKILQWYSYLRNEVLPRRVGEDLDHQFTTKWGRFPPHLRYNTDQVPLPFVVNQESTYTNEEDNDVHIASHGKGDLRKRQFTMHIYISMLVLVTCVMVTLS